MPALFQFPVRPQVLPAILLLQFGPWQFNVMGVYVVLLLVSPPILALLNRGKALRVRAASLAVYAVGAGTRFRLLPSQFEDSFPLLVWQVLFLRGVVAGYYRRSIIAWLSAHAWVVVACTVAALALAFLSWGNPYLAPGRLLNVVFLVVAAYAFLSAYWKPVERALGWFLIPRGWLEAGRPGMKNAVAQPVPQHLNHCRPPPGYSVGDCSPGL